MIKPTVLLLFVLGISGYSILANWHKTHFSLHRSNGYHTFFKSTSVGLIIFVTSSCLYYFSVVLGKYFEINYDFGHWILINVFQLKELDKSTVALFNISLTTLCLGVVTPFIYYLFNDKESLYAEEFLTDADSPDFSRLFGYSITEGFPILFTMSDRKVYIGYIYEVQSKILTSDVHILPVISGYRDEKTLALKKVTPYKELIDRINKKEKSEITERLINLGMSDREAFETLEANPGLYDQWDKFLIALPLREITYAHLHDFTHEHEFKYEERKLKPRIRCK
ncbi:hypothetical protein JFJ09_07260 [Pseudoalteromonas arctica]|uniref:hypothetical protein n=1 Tax=Pseudoalteromonas arctica TaxID=394751 RepID=UPI001C9C6E47|nr:hypothetical protein [Pseudoalteromonas arctica]MBZ2192013.1 hypothetical protein [Pseudoalteromonas arctica]